MSVPLSGCNRPLKGGYWFIREMYRAEVDAAIAKDLEKSGRHGQNSRLPWGRPPPGPPWRWRTRGEKQPCQWVHIRNNRLNSLGYQFYPVHEDCRSNRLTQINLDQCFLLFPLLKRGAIPQREKSREVRSGIPAWNHLIVCRTTHLIVSFFFSIRILFLVLEVGCKKSGFNALLIFFFIGYRWGILYPYQLRYPSRFALQSPALDVY